MTTEIETDRQELIEMAQAYDRLSRHIDRQQYPWSRKQAYEFRRAARTGRPCVDTVSYDASGDRASS